jgi:hypothetical protein
MCQGIERRTGLHDMVERIGTVGSQEVRKILGTNPNVVNP